MVHMEGQQNRRSGKMPGWLVVEDIKTGDVEVLNLERVLNLDAGRDKFGRVIVEVYAGETQHIANIELADWGEFEKLINILPGIDNLGWILVRDGKVDAWRGSLAVRDVKNLTEEEEAAVLEPETGCWDEDAGEFRSPCP